LLKALVDYGKLKFKLLEDRIKKGSGQTDKKAYVIPNFTLRELEI